MIEQYTYFTLAVRERFDLDDAQFTTLKRVCDFEADSLNPANTLSSIFDAALKLARRSELDYQRHLLKSRAYNVISNHFGIYDEEKVLERKAIALSQFILDYLVTLSSMCKFQPIRKIPQGIWEENDLDKITLDRAIDQGIHWDGKVLPKPEVAHILSCIQKKFSELNQLIGDFSMIPEQSVSEELITEKRTLFSRDIAQFRILEMQTYVPPRLYNSDPSRMYLGLNEMRAFYDALAYLKKRMRATDKAAVEKLIEDFRA